MALTAYGYTTNVVETYDHTTNGGSDSLGWTCKQPARVLLTNVKKQGIAADTTGTAYDAGIGAAAVVV